MTEHCCLLIAPRREMRDLYGNTDCSAFLPFCCPLLDLSLRDKFLLGEAFCRASGFGLGAMQAYLLLHSAVTGRHVLLHAQKEFQRWLQKHLKVLISKFYSVVLNQSRSLACEIRAWQLVHNPVASKRMVKMMTVFLLVPSERKTALVFNTNNPESYCECASLQVVILTVKRATGTVSLVGW